LNSLVTVSQTVQRVSALLAMIHFVRPSVQLSITVRYHVKTTQVTIQLNSTQVY